MSSLSDLFKTTVIDPYEPQGMGHLNQADAEMRLSPQEKLLYLRHLKNLNGGEGFNQPNGARSTLIAGTYGVGGREYLLPSVYGGRQVSDTEAVANARQQGLNLFPSYPTWQEGEARYSRLHDFMERDTQ